MVQRRLSYAQENPVTAIDIALEPNAAMVQRAEADNARLLKAYPGGFALDTTHHPHITMLQQFVRTAELDKVYSAASAVLAREGAAIRRLKAIKYYYIPSPPLGIAGIVVESTEDLRRLQYELLDAVAPFTEMTGTANAFVSTDGGRDIQPRTYRLRSQIHHDSSRQKVQSARHNWCRSRDVSQRHGRRTIQGVHVFSDGCSCLPAWQFWLRPQRASSVVADALSVLPEYGVLKRARVNGECQLCGFLDCERQ